jgi:hypothetical protein
MRQHVQGVASQRLSDKFERPHAREQDSSQRQARPEKEARSRVFKMLILKTRVPFSLVSCLRGPGHKRTTDSVFGLSGAPAICPFLAARRMSLFGRPRTHLPFWVRSLLMLLRVDGRVHPALMVAACLHAGTPGIRNQRRPPSGPILFLKKGVNRT